MTNPSVRKVSDFPFDGLPRLSSAELGFQRKLARAREALDSRGELLEELAQPVAKLIKIPLTARVTAVETVSLEDLAAGLPECSLIAQLRLNAKGTRALLVFDTALAQLLINAVLSGGRSVPEESAIDVLRPLTPLSEGVLQYVVVSALERASPVFAGKGIAPAFEDVIREPARLKSLFSNDERFLFITTALTTRYRDYLVRAVLPLSFLEALSSPASEEKAWCDRAAAFGHFKTDFQLEIGRVDVTEADLAGLSAGDIVILDESSVRLESGRLTGGQAIFKPCEGEDGNGFLVDLEVAPEELIATIKTAV